MPSYKIDLPLQPIWMRQPDESEQMYQGFMAYLNSDKYIRARQACIAFGLPERIYERCRWQERADAYWADTGAIMGQSVQTVINRLNVTALEAAFKLMEERTVEETHEMQRVGPEGPVTEQGKRTKVIAPDARIVLALLERMLGAGSTDTDTDVAGLLQAMVSATDPRHAPPTEGGVVEQPGTAQHSERGASELQDGNGEA